MPPVSLPPGFRFHPTDEEIVAYYLSRKINGRKIDLEIIPEVDLYKCEPWDLPGKSLLPSKDMEWFFFSPRDRKYPNGTRTNRATKAGYWKATGKDRKVSSQNRSVGMKKTLVYYRGRAPHGDRSDWVMHEYRLDERECETTLGLQDAYALCRVFKKSTVLVKSSERFNTTGMIPRSAVCSYSNDYSISRSTCSLSVMNEGSSSFDEYNLNDARWVQPTPDESFNFPLSSSFSNHGSISYPPSQLDNVLECARLQNRFGDPPLAPESFPQDLLFDDDNFGITHDLNTTTTAISKCDILQEILSVAQASQDLIQQTASNPFSSWDNLNYAPNLDNGFEFAAEAVRAFDHCERDVEISDLVSDTKVGGMTENLRWVGMSDKELLKTFGEENKIMSMESMTSYNRGSESLHQGDGHINNEIDFDVEFTSSDDGRDTGLVIERGRDPLDDRYSDSPSFEIVEETKVSHDMFVMTRQAAETIFHPIVPSEVMKVHSLHHGIIRNETVTSITEPGKGSILYTLSYLMVHIACVGRYFLSGEVKEHREDRGSIQAEGIRRWGCCRSGRSMSIAIGGRTMLLLISIALALSCVCRTNHWIVDHVYISQRLFGP